MCVFAHQPAMLLQDLFAIIVGLSYQGDIRMAFAEDARKVQRIVDGSYMGLQAMYLPLLQVRCCCASTAGHLHSQPLQTV